MSSDKINLILASGSPRRKYLLQQLGYSFKVLKTNVEESYPSSLDMMGVPEYLARKKADSVRSSLGKNDVVITADTVVVLGDEIIEKAAGREEAIAHLQRLSGAMHTVVSGVCINSQDREISFSDQTKVYFKELNSEMIEYYVDHFEPYDKAGAYAIQEWIGMVGIEKIEGSYFNVMGLPVHRLYEELQKFYI